MNNINFYILSLILSITGCTLSNSWIVTWFWIELQSLSLIPILSLNVSPRSIEATSKYFLFQAIGSVLLLLGILLRYFNESNLNVLGNYNIIELIIIIFAITLKMGIFPNHFWFLDVMQGVNFLTGFFVAIVSKIIPIYIVIVISSNSTQVILSTIGILSVIIGSVFGVQQTQLRKLIALSSITHLGWMLIVFSNTTDKWIGIILFISYIVMTLPLFWLGNTFSIEHLAKTTNVSNSSILSTMLSLSILSIAGLPPLLGFFYKWLMFYNVISSYNYLIVTTLIIASLLSLYFYIQICISFYFNQWPLIKTMFNNTLVNSNKINIISLVIVFSNVLLYYTIWNISPLSTSWSF